MNRVIWSFLLAVSVTCGDMSARAIMDEQITRHTIPHETTVMNIQLIDRKGHQETRTLRRLDKDRGNNLTSSLTVFDAPADIKGTALLTRENEGKPNDQWLYLPSLRRLQRIAQARRSAYFMGTDFTYEDMDPEDIEDYLFKHVNSETIDGTACFVIEAVPATEKLRRASGYSKRVLWIRKDIYLTIRIEFHDRKGKLIKTQINSELENVQGDIWRVNKAVVDNIDKRHQTVVNVVSRDIETELDEGFFSDRYILTGRYMQ